MLTLPRIGGVCLIFESNLVCGTLGIVTSGSLQIQRASITTTDRPSIGLGGFNVTTWRHETLATQQQVVRLFRSNALHGRLQTARPIKVFSWARRWRRRCERRRRRLLAKRCHIERWMQRLRIHNRWSMMLAQVVNCERGGRGLKGLVKLGRSRRSSAECFSHSDR